MTTATSDRNSDKKLADLEKWIGGAFATRYEIAKFLRKVEKDIPLVNLRELSSGDIPTGRAETVTIPVLLTDIREAVSGDIPSGRVETVTIGVPLTSLREVTVAGETADLMTDVDFGGTADRQFGLLGGETTPKLQPEGGEGGADELAWAASGNDPVAFKISIPDIDTASDLTVTLRAVMASTTDTPAFALDSYFDEGDTKVEDTSGTVDNTTENVVATIAASDIPSGARTLGVELTPAAHTTDVLTLYEIRVSYTSTRTEGAGGVLDKGTTPILEATNGDTDGNLRLNWAAGNVDPITFKVSLPNIDTTGAITVTVRGMLSDTDDDGMTCDLDSYIEAGGGTAAKVSDASGTTWEPERGRWPSNSRRRRIVRTRSTCTRSGSLTRAPGAWAPGVSSTRGPRRYSRRRTAIPTGTSV
jgi:hypothetical protein